MKQLFLLLLLLPALLFAQEKHEGRYSVDVNYFYGNILPHSKAIQHLIFGHPDGVIISANRRAFGEKEWEALYNYPDVGLSFHYQDMKNPVLGNMYGLYGHYNFYFLKRHLMLRLGQGLAYNTNPYDRETNFRNQAYSTHLMPSSYFMLNFQKADVWQGLGVQAGLTFIHHSNANMKAPNISTNTFAVTAGVNYIFAKDEVLKYIPPVTDSIKFTQPFKYNIALRGGINQSDLIGSKQYPYYAVSLYADKRWCRKSAFQLGTDVFWAKYLEEFIRYKSIAFPEEHIDGSTDYRRIGLFVGHELFVNSLSLETQAGIYIYSPFKNDGSLYQRIGLKYYFGSKIFAALSLKTHLAQAEVMEFGVGVRL
jgi:hypothetical protein